MSNQNESRFIGYVRRSAALQMKELSAQRLHLKQFAPKIFLMESEQTQGWLSRLLKYFGRLFA